MGMALKASPLLVALFASLGSCCVPPYAGPVERSLTAKRTEAGSSGRIPLWQGDQKRDFIITLDPGSLLEPSYKLNLHADNRVIPIPISSDMPRFIQVSASILVLEYESPKFDWGISCRLYVR